MSNYITTFSKLKFNPIDPNKKDISIDDIAHSLSLLTRANGHFPEFYSVAQHCILCCEESISRGYSIKYHLLVYYMMPVKHTCQMLQDL